VSQRLNTLVRRKQSGSRERHGRTGSEQFQTCTDAGHLYTFLHDDRKTDAAPSAATRAISRFRDGRRDRCCKPDVWRRLSVPSTCGRCRVDRRRGKFTQPTRDNRGGGRLDRMWRDESRDNAVHTNRPVYIVDRYRYTVTHRRALRLARTSDLFTLSVVTPYVYTWLYTLEVGVASCWNDDGSSDNRGRDGQHIGSINFFIFFVHMNKTFVIVNGSSKRKKFEYYCK